MVDIVSQANQKIVGMFGGITGKGVVTFFGWVLLIIVVLGVGYWFLIYYRNKKIFSKIITAFDIEGPYYVPAIRDTAKVVKIGTGGFEILYLKKMKTWKIAYGGRVGRNTYYFFIGRDGYWVNGMLSSNIYSITKEGGLIPIVSTNPNMRAQYTALEKQIDTLHADKKSFMDKYGSWVFGIGFLIIIGMFAWLIFKEFNGAMGTLTSVTNSQSQMLDKINLLIDKLGVKSAQTGTGGLIPVA